MKFTVLVLLLSILPSAYASNSPTALTRETAKLTDLAGHDLGGYIRELAGLSVKSPELHEQVLDQQARQNPTMYEIYRRFRYEQSATLEESLIWATKTEIEEDSVDANGEPINFEMENLLQNVNSTPILVRVNIDKDSQTMDVEGPGIHGSNIPIATARHGYHTTNGCYRGLWHQRDHYSKKYHAHMPYSVFFNGGDALHVGSPYVKSHGCVHLPVSYAKDIYDVAVAYGAASIYVCVQGEG